MRIALILFMIISPTPALAYIGPGAGISAIGTALALLGAVFLLLVGFVWYPVKRLLRRQSRRDRSVGEGQEP